LITWRCNEQGWAIRGIAHKNDEQYPNGSNLAEIKPEDFPTTFIYKALFLPPI